MERNGSKYRGLLDLVEDVVLCFLLLLVLLFELVIKVVLYVCEIAQCFVKELKEKSRDIFCN